jgi:PAS domain-containing protein
MMEGRRSRFSIDKRMSRKDGRSIWVRVTVSALEHDGEGRPRYALGMIEDITERRRQDDHYSALLGKLTQVQALFETAFRNAALGMDLTDDNGRFLQVNRALCEMVGYSEDELLGMRWHDITHPDDLAASEQRFDMTFKGGDVVDFTKRYVHGTAPSCGASSIPHSCETRTDGRFSPSLKSRTSLVSESSNKSSPKYKKWRP